VCIQISILAGCKVESEWCFGRCGAGPNVLVVKDGQDSFMTDVRTLEETSAAVEQATGRLPVLDAALASSLRRMRVVHAFEQELARAEMLAHCSTCTADDVQRNRQLDNAVSIVDTVIGGAGNAHPLLQAQHLKRSMLALRLDPTGDLDCTWQRVACWQLDAVEPRSEWSSVFRFSSSDAASSTLPLPRTKVAPASTRMRVELTLAPHRRSTPGTEPTPPERVEAEPPSAASSSSALARHSARLRLSR